MFHKNVLWLGDPTFYDMDRKKRKVFIACKLKGKRLK